MSDFESRLTAALAEGAQDAPGVVGLAHGARRRAAVRRRRRVSVVAVAAVLAVLVPLGVVRGLGGDDGRTRVVADAPGGWKTVEADGLLMDVPDAWVELQGDGMCSRWTVWGEAGHDATCLQSEAVRVATQRAALDYAFGPGLHPASDLGGAEAAWIGYVSLDQADVSVSSDDGQVALRVLGSVREEGEDVPDLTGTWTTVTEHGLVFPVPAGLADDVQVVVDEVGQHTDGPWRYVTTITGGRTVRVAAPTLALAQTIGGSSRAAGAAAESARWVTVTVADVSVDVPSGWSEQRCGATQTLLPEGDRCGSDGPRVTFVDEGSAFYVGPSLSENTGSVVAGSQIVGVSNAPFETMRRILASARPAGTDAPDVATWRTLQLERGVTAVVPDDPGVRVMVSGVIPSCTGERAFARPTTGGRWTAGICADRLVTVIAPTQALADLVAVSVDHADVPDRLRAVTVGRAEVAIPADWVEAPGCTGSGDRPAYGPPGGDEACATVPGAFEVPATFTLADADGITTCPTSGGCAYRRVGDGGVLVRGLDRSLVEQVYDSIRLPD